MANHMEAVLDRETSPEEIEALLRKCNDERFKGVFGITKHRYLEEVDDGQHA